MTDQSQQPDDHLSPEQIARYLDPTASVLDQKRMEAHLAKCDYCRGEVVATKRLIQARKRNRRWLFAVPVAAAAAVVFLLVAPPSQDSLDEGRPVRAGSEGGQRVEVVAPANDSSIAADSISFIWRDVGDVAQYSLRVTDTTGDVVVSETSSDTVLVLATRQHFRPGRTYFWFVDALFGDGESATTGIRRFKIPP